jgi:hypothetical protein
MQDSLDTSVPVSLTVPDPLLRKVFGASPTGNLRASIKYLLQKMDAQVRDTPAKIEVEYVKRPAYEGASRLKAGIAEAIEAGRQAYRESVTAREEAEAGAEPEPA